MKIKGASSILNFQPSKRNEFFEITNNRIQSNNVCECIYQNDFVRKNIERNINRRSLLTVKLAAAGDLNVLII